VAIVEGPDTPKLLPRGGRRGRGLEGQEDRGLRRIKQLNVDYVLSGAGRVPWTEADLRARIERYKAAALRWYNLMIGDFRTPSMEDRRDEEIEKVIQSFEPRQGRLPVIEYNFYAHRAMEAITSNRSGGVGIHRVRL